MNFNRRGVFLETGANGWCFGSGHSSSRSSRDLTTSAQWVLDYERQGRAGERLVPVPNLSLPLTRVSFLREASCAWGAMMDAYGCGETLALGSRSVSGPTRDRSRSSLTYGGARRWGGDSEVGSWLPCPGRCFENTLTKGFRRRWAERGRRTDYVREYQPPKKEQKTKSEPKTKYAAVMELYEMNHIGTERGAWIGTFFWHRGQGSHRERPLLHQKGTRALGIRCNIASPTGWLDGLALRRTWTQHPRALGLDILFYSLGLNFFFPWLLCPFGALGLLDGHSAILAWPGRPRPRQLSVF